MASVDQYSPCPCGSGQKFKWCCQKVEAYADRAHRLFENGQIDQALATIEEGLSKDSGNPWLLTRKAIYLLRQRQPEPAKAALRLVLEKQSKHIGAHLLLARLVLETEGPIAGLGSTSTGTLTHSRPKPGRGTETSRDSSGALSQ